MASEGQKSRERPPLVLWLARANAELSSWAASMPWWRLIVLFFVVVIAANLVADTLHLRHQRIRVATSKSGGDEVEITQVGPDGVRITRRRAEGKQAGTEPPSAAASGADAPDVQTAPVPPEPPHPDDDDDESPRMVRRTVGTFGGFVGDLGGALIFLVFAYLVAAKIVVRKVAAADAKVRTAEDAAGREAMERQLVQARLQVLQAQVEPHFLFNTLAAVDYLIETDPPRASQMQKALITYLRGALPQMREDSSTVGRELRLIRSYLELMKMRIEDRLEVHYEVPPELEGAEFPPMVLQSLVENAIKHGIEPKPEGGKVTVVARVAKGQLVVEVRDTGIGIMDLDRLEAPTSGTGIGLQNIRERLSMLYAGRGHLSLVSDSAAGTTVRVSVPYQPSTAPAPGAAPVKEAGA